MDDFDFLSGSSDDVAKRLLGCELVREINGTTLRLRIVETESYDQNDPASHAYSGKTMRNQVMYGPPGHLYVYFTYGMHYCANIVCGSDGYGSGVLLRAGEPLDGVEEMSTLRGGIVGKNIANGPAKLTQALQIDFDLRGHNLHDSPLTLVVRPPLPNKSIVVTTRIGISKAADQLRRFYILDNPCVSKK